MDEPRFKNFYDRLRRKTLNLPQMIIVNDEQTVEEDNENLDDIVNAINEIKNTIDEKI